MAGPSMSMNRVIHAAVRRDLARFQRALADLPDGDRARADALHRAWQNFHEQLTDHHEGEHEIGWTGLRAVGIEQEVIDQFDREHDQMAAALAAAGDAMTQLQASASRADADVAGMAMERLKDTATTHLEHEEAVTEPAYQQHHDHPAVKEMTAKFRRRAGLARAGVFVTWLEDGATAQERAGLRENIPGPVVAVLVGLFGRGYRRDIASVWTASRT